jgi:hypothetical protein
MIGKKVKVALISDEKLRFYLPKDKSGIQTVIDIPLVAEEKDSHSIVTTKKRRGKKRSMWLKKDKGAPDNRYKIKAK